MGIPYLIHLYTFMQILNIVKTRPEVYRSNSVSVGQLPFGSHLGQFGSHLGPFGNHWRPFGNHLGLFGNHLGDTWCHLVVILVDSDRQSKFLSESASQSVSQIATSRAPPL